MLTLVTAAATEPVSVDEARVHARIGTDTQLEGNDIALKLVTARSDRESFTKRQFITAEYQFSFCDFRRVIRLPLPPLISITHVKYYDANNVLQTIDNTGNAVFLTHVPGGDRAPRGSIEFLSTYTFPAKYERADAVQITFLCGYGLNPSSVPAPLRSGILLVLSELYANREEQTIGTIVSTNLRAADALCWPFRDMS